MQFVELPRSEYIDLLLSYRGDGRVKILTGLRRVGKSYILHKLFKAALLKNGVALDHIIELDLEDENNQLCRGNLTLVDFCQNRLVDQQTHYVLIDEAQRADNFWGQLTTLRLQPYFDVYATGSNAKFLTVDVDTNFRGRAKPIEVWPLTYNNVLHYLGQPPSDDTFEYYVRYGGMPELQKETTEEEKENYLRALFSTVYHRDIVERYDIEHAAELEMLLRYMASTTGSLVNPLRIANAFQSRGHKSMTLETVNSYLKYFDEAKLLYKAQRYDIRGQQHINSVEKYYFADSGLRNAIVGFNEPDRGAMLETLVYNELRRQGYQVSVGVVAAKPLPYEGEPDKSLRTYEVDFVARKASKVFYIQCALGFDSEAQRKRELRPFHAIKDFRKRVMISASPSTFFTYDSDGVLWLPIKELLTNRNALDY